MVCQKPEKAPTAKPPLADIDPTLGLIGRRVKLKDGREGTIQYAASSDGLERFEVKLDNGDTVRLRGPNTTKPSPPRPAAAVSSETAPNSSSTALINRALTFARWLAGCWSRERVCNSSGVASEARAAGEADRTAHAAVGGDERRPRSGAANPPRGRNQVRSSSSDGLFP